MTPVDAGLEGVRLDAGAEAEAEVDDAGAEVVAGVLHVGADTELVAGGRFVEPVLPLDVVGFPLARSEG